jgi:hypothetical protein
VEQRVETELILIKDEEQAEDVWKTDPQEELRITGEGGCDHKGYGSVCLWKTVRVWWYARCKLLHWC